MHDSRGDPISTTRTVLSQHSDDQKTLELFLCCLHGLFPRGIIKALLYSLTPISLLGCTPTAVRPVPQQKQADLALVLNFDQKTLVDVKTDFVFP